MILKIRNKTGGKINVKIVALVTSILRRKIEVGKEMVEIPISPEQLDSINVEELEIEVEEV